MLYKEDFSYAVLSYEENYYFISNGSDISFDTLPIFKFENNISRCKVMLRNCKVGMVV